MTYLSPCIESMKDLSCKRSTWLAFVTYNWQLSIGVVYSCKYSLADICTTDDYQIKAHISRCMKGPIVNAFEWPIQGNPTNHDWQVWKECLKQVFSYNNLARKPLEDWMQHSSQWFSVYFNNAYFRNRTRHGLDMTE